MVAERVGLEKCALRKSSVESDDFLHDLPQVNQRGFVFAEVDLKLGTIGAIDHRFDGGVHDPAAMHVDPDAIADGIVLERGGGLGSLFAGHGAGAYHNDSAMRL
jgi:hypothetical protein